MQKDIRYVTATDGVRIHYEVEGGGEPLVLQHGFTGSVLGWYRAGYVDALKGRYQLVLVDARGHGLSDKPYNVEAHAVEKRAGDVIAVLDELGLRQAHIWGYSMGGRIALEMGRSHVDRVRTLVIGGMSGDAPGGSQRYGLERRAKMLEARRMEPSLARAEGQDVSPQEAEEVRQRLLSNDPKALAASTRGLFLWPGVEDDLPRMQMPVLIYCGSADGVQARAEQNAKALPKGQFVLLPGLNHRQAFQRSDLVLPHVLPFLERFKS